MMAPRALRPATCAGQGCGQPIAFIVTTAGRHMPVDPELVTRAFVRGRASGSSGRVSLITPEGELVSGQEELGHPDTKTYTGYVPHWGTCPARTQFRTQRPGSMSA
jgi:hypothetical protein